MAKSSSVSASPTNEQDKNSRTHSRQAKTVTVFVIGIIFIVAFSVMEDERTVSRIQTLQQQQQQQALAMDPPKAVHTTTVRSKTAPSYTTIKNTSESLIVLPAFHPVDNSTTMMPQPPPTRPPQRPPSSPPQQIILPPQRVHRNITLIVQLRGELGNQLSVLANARITQLIAREKYPHIHIQLIGQHQYDESKKWMRGRDDLMKCFSNAFHDFDFEGGIYDDEFRTVQTVQQSWLSVAQRNKLSNVRSFHFLDSLLLQQEKSHNHPNSSIPVVPSSASKYSLPYLTAASFSWIDCIRNEGYYNEIRQWLSFNMNACCNPKVRPRDNDIVFHYRNFAHELRNSQRNGRPVVVTSNFLEISPDIAANVAFIQHTVSHNNHNNNNNSHFDRHSLPPNIAITSRYETGTDPYIAAFRSRNLTSHYVTGQHNGVEGFCYILQAQKEIFGSYHSTYFRWAALLGNATINRFYTLDPIATTTASQHSGQNTGNISPTTTSTVTPPPPSLLQQKQQQGPDFAVPPSELPRVSTMETIQHHHRTILIEKYSYYDMQ